MRALVTSVAAGALLVVPAGVAYSVEPLPNPDLQAGTCGLDTTLILDASGSIPQYNATEDVRKAGASLVAALIDTGSTLRITQFATFTELLAPRTLVTPESAPGQRCSGEGLVQIPEPGPGTAG